MPILKYTTTITVSKTVSEIQDMLAKAGAQAIMQEYDGFGTVSTLTFRMMTPGGLVSFRMPCNSQGVLKSLKQSKISRVKKTPEQAARVAWRIVRDWVAVQLAMIEAEQADTVELFLPFAQDSSGRTVYEKLKSTGFKQLTHQTSD